MGKVTTNQKRSSDWLMREVADHNPREEEPQTLDRIQEARSSPGDQDGLLSHKGLIELLASAFGVSLFASHDLPVQIVAVAASSRAISFISSFYNSCYQAWPT